jgi:hypothetical protein
MTYLAMRFSLSPGLIQEHNTDILCQYLHFPLSHLEVGLLVVKDEMTVHILYT